MGKYHEIDLSKIKTTSIYTRKSKVNISQLGQPIPADSTFQAFWKSLPPLLAVQDISELVESIVKAIHHEKPVLAMMGAHVIKVGLGPVIIDLIKEGFLQGIALNGAGAIHDVEMAYFGKTSEEVSESLVNGLFGMASETADIINQVSKTAAKEGLGFGESLGLKLAEEKPPHLDISIAGQAYMSNIPLTVHVALGTDVVHQHASADGAAIGETSLRDFRIWSRLVNKIDQGGVVLLFGSAVILPEVFLKALTLARNIHGNVKDFTTAVFDMIQHYRPNVNVLQRPVLDGGKSFKITGHHEIMIPLLAAAMKEKINEIS